MELLVFSYFNSLTPFFRYYRDAMKLKGISISVDSVQDFELEQIINFYLRNYEGNDIISLCFFMLGEVKYSFLGYYNKYAKSNK